MKVLLLITSFILVSCGSTQYVLHSKPEHFIIKNGERTGISSLNGVALTYDRSPFVRVEGKDDKGRVRLFYKIILSNFSKNPVELSRNPLFLVDKELNKKYKGKYKKIDKVFLTRKIDQGERLELDVIFDVDQDTIDSYEGEDKPLLLTTSLKDNKKLTLKVWLWSL